MIKRWIPYIVIACSVFLLVFAYFTLNIIIFFIGIIGIVSAVLLVIFIETILLFKQDKELDIDALKEQGLTIVRCKHCKKQNVFEDQYCIYCHEPLTNNNNNNTQ